MSLNLNTLALLAALPCSMMASEIKVEVEHIPSEAATSGYLFKRIRPPVKNDAAASGTIEILSGAKDPNAAPPESLTDGKLAGHEDSPRQNFFFRASTPGGRILLKLDPPMPVKEINTFSWHPNTRGPQVYQVYGIAGSKNGETMTVASGEDPIKKGWQLIAAVDTRLPDSSEGGQFGVSISSSGEAIGTYEYLLFDMQATQQKDPFGNTFYTEIDVVDARAISALEPIVTPGGVQEKIITSFAEAEYSFVLDTTEAPDLTEWAVGHLVPLAKEWYPRIVDLLPSEGFEAPKKVSIIFREGMGGVPAAAAGTRIHCNANWFRQNLKGEAIGSVVHEMVHVVQRYNFAGLGIPRSQRVPSWITEGIPDYIRWYLYEPQSKGAEITNRNVANARFDSSYRVTANFLNWATEKYDRELVRKLNESARSGRYTAEFWKDLLGQSVEDLGAEWKAENEQKLLTQ